MTATALVSRETFLAAIEAAPLDQTARLAYADWCDENGDPETAARIRAGKFQLTQEGDRMVVVGRDGADHDRHGNGIYTTKVYEAARRKRDGLLTWRLSYSLAGHRTSGKTVTGPMIRRAEEYAASVGLPVATHITHGTVCV